MPQRATIKHRRTTLLLAACAALAAMPAVALDIALSNDDGWSAPGLQALREVFERAGHRVTLAAPADQQSGSSAGISTGALRVRRESGNEYSVQACRDRACETLEGAEPATSALVAIDIATRRAGGRRPDLLISGINPGANTGAAAQISGTVGAAIAAASHVLDAGVPAIAVSTELPAGCQREQACAVVHYRQVAGFVLRLVGHLARESAGRDVPARLLPPGMLLNVNHPGETPRGVRIGRQGLGITNDGSLAVLGTDCIHCAEVAVGEVAEGATLQARPDGAPELPDSDTTDFLQGYVTIVPMRADYTADDWRHLRSLLGKGGWADAPRTGAEP